MKTILVISLSIILLVWLLPTTARTYRWVDENGVTIYSQSPPPAGKATVIKDPPPADNPPDETMKKLKARLDVFDEARKKKNQTKEQQELAAKNAATKKRNCENATKNLTTLEQHARVRMKTDSGDFKHLTEEERAAEIDKAQEAVKKNCE